MKKMTKQAVKLAMLPLLALTLTACGGGKTKESESATPKNDSVVVAINKNSEPEEGLNPIYGINHGTIPLIQSTLVTYDADMNIKNDLATKVNVSEDGKTWTFDLRNDVKFTDGKLLTPEDVAFTFEEIKKSASEVDLTMLDKVTTKDQQVIFQLKEPQSTFLNTVATIGIVPKHAYTKDYGEKPIGSGPYEFVEWNKGEQMILKANPDYYGDKPKIDKVTLLFMDEDAAYAAAKSGSADVALVSATQAENKIPGMDLKVIKTQDNRGITMPVEPATGKKTEDGYPIGNNVTSDLAIRKALVYGLDRDEMAKNTVNGFASPAYTENDGLPWSNPDVKVTTNRSKAEEILKEGGWVKGKDGILEKNGQKAEFDLYYLTGDSVRQALSMDSANQAEELGIKINVKSGTWDDITKVMFSNPILMGWGSSTPQISYSLFHGKNKYKTDFYNPEGYDNAVVNKYLDDALQANDPKTANEFFKKAQWDGKTGTSMLGDAPWIWLVNIDHLYFVKDGLDIGKQPLHPHGASWPLLGNLKDWKWSNGQ